MKLLKLKFTGVGVNLNITWNVWQFEDDSLKDAINKATEEINDEIGDLFVYAGEYKEVEYEISA